VISTTPAAGSTVRRGTRVEVVVSTGPASVGVPYVHGLTEAEAVRKLRHAGLVPTPQPRSSSSVPSGQVIATEPAQGVPLVAGSPVTVVVSSGPAQVSVPEVTGQSEGEARASLRAVGLRPGAVTHREVSGQAPGTVLSQSPAAGAAVASGTAVSLVVAKAPQEVTVPRVVGHKRERAEGELVGAGFAVHSTTRPVTSEAEAGLVLQQSPAGGVKAKQGVTVTLTVGVLSTSTTPTPTTPSTTPTTTAPSTTTTSPAPTAGPAP
jgi:serine/threonine-protein kinase